MKDLRISSTRTKYALPTLGALAVLSALLSLCLGAVPLGPGEVFSALAGRESGAAAQIVLYARLPRTCGCLLAGAALAAAGTIIQGVLGNPLAAPNVIGVNAGAGLCTALCAALWPARTAALPFAAFLGALGGVGLVLAIGTRTGASRMTLVLAGSAVSFAGLLGFVGLIAPHMVRRLVGEDSSARLLWAAALGGAALLTVCDILARTLFAPYELPVGVVLSLLGGPFFLWLLLRQRRGRRRGHA